MENKMFCFQCQETAGCTGCTKFGVCGKSPDLARMQDLLIYVTKGLSEVTTRLREEGQTISQVVNNYITINLFTTITNANFDDAVFYERVKETLRVKNELIAKFGNEVKGINLVTGAIDKQIASKRKMLLDIEKENVMTIASALRSIPKKEDKASENPLLKVLRGEA